MRPIIEYHGPLFQLLSNLTKHVGYPDAVLLWQICVVGWLVLLAVLALTARFTHFFTAIVLLGIVLLRVPGLGMLEQNVDESQWIVSAATLVHDPYFWRSVDGTTSGPLNVWLPALMYYLGFGLDYTTLRLWGLLTCALPTAWLLLATFRHQVGERVARLAIIPVATCLALTTDPDGVAFNSEQLPMTVLALAGFLLSRVFRDAGPGQSPGWGWPLALGVVLGCLPYTKLQATPIGLVLAVWGLAGLFSNVYTPATSRFRWLTAFILGGLVPTVLVGIYLLATDLTEYAVRSYLLVNLEYAQTGSWGAGTVDWADRVLIRLPEIYGSMRSTNWFWRLGLLLSGLWIVKLVFLPAKIHPVANRLWFIGSACLVSLYAILQPGNSFPHYQWLSFVPVSWLIGEMLHRLITTPANTRWVRHRWTWTAVATVLLVSIGYPGWLAVSRFNPGIEQLATVNRRSHAAAVSTAIRQYARPNDSMVIWGWSNNLHVETGLLMGSRFIPLYFPVVEGPQQAYFLDVYRQDLLANRPAVIVDAVDLHPANHYDSYPTRRYPVIQAILDARYQLMDTVNGAKIYALRK